MKHNIYILLFILLTVFIVTYIYFFLYNKKPTYTFIHPTKTGGTACEMFFRNYYSEFINGEGHDNKCTNDNNPIIIIRDPIDRFISMYKYWKGGSCDMYNYKRSKVFVQNYHNYTIKDFIKLIKNNRYDVLCQDFTWDLHFQPITNWINNTNYKNIIIILYEKNLNEKINKLLSNLKIKNKGVELPMINISNNKETIKLDNEDIIFVQSYFANDFKLCDNIKNRPELFKFVI